MYAAPSLAYHQNRPFHREKNEAENIARTRKVVKNGEEVDENLYGFEDGKTYIWEVEESLNEILEEGKGERNIASCKYSQSESNTEGWHDPVINPQINKYEFSGTVSPKSSAFGNTRASGVRFHHGIDIFAIPITTPVYACLDSKYISRGAISMTLEIIETKALINQMNAVDYTLQYPEHKEYKAGKKKASVNKVPKGEEATFSLKETDVVQFKYIHLDTMKDTKDIEDENGIVKAGTVIGYAGVEGANGTHAPHLHLEVYNTTVESNYILNPALFIKLQSFNDNEQDNAKKKWLDKANRKK